MSPRSLIDAASFPASKTVDSIAEEALPHLQRLLSQQWKGGSSAHATGSGKLTPRQANIVQFVAKCSLATLDQIADRFARKEHESLLDARPRTKAILARLTVRGYLNLRPIVVDHVAAAATGDPSKLVVRHYFVEGFNITPRAATEFQLALPQTLRDSFVTHHVKTVDAALQVERNLRSAGYTVRDFKTEAELISTTFKGKLFDGHQQIIPTFPDARLEVVAPDGSTHYLNIEYVSSKYTSEMIRQKARDFEAPTIWATSNESTAARVTALTGATPIMV